MVVIDDLTKLEQRTHGPYLINQIFTNGTVEIQLTAENATVIHIQKLVPIPK
jgi:hypothetical protein